MKLFTLILIALLMSACTYQTTTEEEMAKSWAQSGTIAPKSSQAVQLQAQFTEAGNYTVQFFLDGPDQDAINGTRITNATVTWSVHGNSVTRTIDVLNGTSIQGTAEAVSVKVTDASTGAIVDPYLVSIQVTKGSRASVQQPPILTGAVETFAAGAGSNGVSIPQGAGIISAYVTVCGQAVGAVLNPDDFVVTQNSGAGLLKSYSPLRITGWVPIASGTTDIQLFQAAGAPATVWNITFGIDG